MTYTTPNEPEHAPDLDATDARQGRWGRHMLWVLLAGQCRPQVGGGVAASAVL